MNPNPTRSPMNWRTATRAEIQANPIAYHRSRFLELRKSWPQHTKLELTEYGWLLHLSRRNPRPLARLVEAEARA